MRTKNFLITLCVIVTLSLAFIIFGQHKPATIKNIVTTTNEQIQNFKDNLRDAETKTLIADEKLLEILGFNDENPRLYPKDVWKNTSLPVVVTYVLEGQESQAVGLIGNVARVLPNNSVLVYNLGLTDYGLKTVDEAVNIMGQGNVIFTDFDKIKHSLIIESLKKMDVADNLLQNYCNNSRCQVVTFDLYDFPSHIEDEVLHAYRPIVIQDALSRTGAILFLECSYRFMHNVTHTMVIDLYQKRVLKQGVLAFPLTTRNPVTSLTHKKMFDYFHTDAENFQFLQMVKADVLFFINTKEIHEEIMLPWIQCALTQDCIFPIGAQSAGCKFDKKPSYRYSGCHSYDASALNIVLGLRFKFTSNEYTFRKLVALFSQVPLRKADAILKELELNATTDGHLQAVAMS